MTVFIMLGSDDYICRRIIGVYPSRARAEEMIPQQRTTLISRQGEPTIEITEWEITQ